MFVYAIVSLIIIQCWYKVSL